MANRNFIQQAIQHPGALHQELGVPQGQKIPGKKLAAAAKKGGVEGRRARFAQTLKHLSAMRRGRKGPVRRDSRGDTYRPGAKFDSAGDRIMGNRDSRGDRLG